MKPKTTPKQISDDMAKFISEIEVKCTPSTYERYKAENRKIKTDKK